MVPALLFSAEPLGSMWCFPIPQISWEALLARGVRFHQQASPKHWTLSEVMPAIPEMASNARNLSPDKSQPVQRCVHSLLPPHTCQLSLRLFMGRQHQALLRAGTTLLGAFWVQGKNSGLSSYRLRSPCCSYCSSFPRKAESGKNFPLFS